MRARSTAASVCPARTSTPPVARAQRKHVARAAPDPTGVVAGSIAASTVAARSAAEMPVLVRALRLDRHAERGVEPRACSASTISGISSSSSRSRRHRQADQAAAVRRHEVDRLRRDLLGGDRQVAFVLAILVVDDDDHLAGADRGDRVLDAGERTGACAAPLAMRDLACFVVMCSLCQCDRPRRDVSPAQLRGADDVLADHVAFEVDAIADLRAAAGWCAASVNGTICTSNRSSPRPATVRLMPSTAIDPLRTM